MIKTIATETTTISDFKVDEVGQVIGFLPGHKAYRQKLLAMGLTPGTQFKVSRKAPLGDPIEIQLRGFSLSIRKHEAASLKVVKVQL